MANSLPLVPSSTRLTFLPSVKVSLCMEDHLLCQSDELLRHWSTTYCTHMLRSAHSFLSVVDAKSEELFFDGSSLAAAVGESAKECRHINACAVRDVR